MKLKLLVALFLFSTFLSNAQSNQELAEKYLKERGELVFSFTANNIDEIKQLSRIISFDHGQDSNNPFTVNAIANKKDFEKFLTFNLPYIVNVPANKPKEVVMFDPKIHKKGVSGKNAGYTLSFPLTAYPNYSDYVQQMDDFVNDNPTFARIENIGTTPGSAAGAHDLLFIVLSDSIAKREAEPRIMYTSSIHGDEIAGYPMMLSLIDYLINAYKDTGNSDHTRVKNLLDNSEIWINPLANPDGTFRISNNSVNNAIRGNANAIDMNRNYPEPEGSSHPDGNVYQSETLDFMSLADTYHFVLSANFHGGAEVVNYPWDFTYNRHIDDTWLINVSKEYADNVQDDGPSGYFTSVENSGYTHGADWYLIAGGRQDYMTYEKHGREITMEISDTKLISESQIQNHWNYNREALLDYLLQGTYGFRGVVKDATTGTPIDAKITVVGRDDQPLSRNSWAETELPLGDFYRPIEAGTYDILIEANADCYIPITLNRTITNYQTIDLGDILLQKVTDSSPSNAPTTAITATTATLNWDNINGASNYSIRYREQGTTNWTTTTSGVNSKDISGLNVSTTYEFQVNVTCNSNTSAYSTLTNFTTLAANYCDAAGQTYTSEYISNVTIEGVSNSTPSAPSSGYSDFTGSIIFPDLDVNFTGNYTIEISKGFNGGPWDEAVAAWIDKNGDGTFAASEMIFDSPSSTTTPVSTTFNVLGANVGQTRLRIILKYYSGSGSNITESCDPDAAIQWGEVEDYTVNIVDSTLGIQDELLSTFSLYPNPTDIGEIKLTLPNEIEAVDVLISNVLGQKLVVTKLVNRANKIHTISTSNLKTGVYFITISTELGRSTKKMIVQ